MDISIIHELADRLGGIVQEIQTHREHLPPLALLNLQVQEHWNKAIFCLRSAGHVDTAREFQADLDAIVADLRAAPVGSFKAVESIRLLGLKFGEAADALRPANVASTHSASFHPSEIRILRALASNSATMTQEQLAKNTELDVKTIRKYLAKLRLSNYTHRPSGDKGGEALTATGREFLSKLPDDDSGNITA